MYIVFLILLYVGTIPLPSVGKTEKHFRDHREHYLQMVEQARQDHFQADSTMYDSYIESEMPLVIAFMPKHFYQIIVYAELRRDAEMVAGCFWGDGRIEKQLERNWWLCEREWN
jgi:hypothetical protein